jgi:hypothetical protein
MGNIVSAPIKTILSKYTYNFQSQQLNLEILKGRFQLEHLIINDKEINALLAENGLPVRLKFGVLKKFDLKLSIMGAKLERLDVEDLILILGPAESYDQKFEGEEEQEMYNLILKNYIAKMKNSKQTSYLNPNVFIEKERKRKITEMEKRLKIEKSKKEQEDKAKKAPPKDPNKSINLMGIEIFQLIKNVLDCSINIQNVYIIYEDNLDFLYSQEDLSSFIVTLHLKQLKFQNDVVTKHTDKDGIFKNFMNISAFLQKSGTWSLSDTAYWSITLESFNFFFTIGNPLFINDYDNNRLITLQNVGAVYKKFEEAMRANRQNAFDVFTLTRVACDFIIFYKETSKIPIHGVFLFFDMGNINFKIEIHKIAVLMDVASHFQTMAIAKELELVKPKFKILTPAAFDQMALRLKLSYEHKGYLKAINRVVIREYLSELFYISRYNELVRDKISPEEAKTIVLTNFCKESRIYKLIFGDQLPEMLLTEGKKVNLNGEAKAETKKAPEILKPPTEVPVDTKNLKDNEMVLILGKIHMHVRLQLNLTLKILSPKTIITENSLIVDGLIVDILKPVGHLKTKLHLTLNKLAMSYNRTLFKSIAKSKMAIFDNIQAQRLDRSMAVENSENLLELKPTSMSFEFNLEEGRNNKTIYMVYSSIKIGQMIYNYVPLVFKGLARNLIRLSQFHSRSFNTRIMKDFEKNIQEIGTGKKGLARKQVTINNFKASLFQKKVVTIQKSDPLMPKKNPLGGSSYIGFKKSNVVVDFDRNQEKQREQMKTLENNLVSSLEE